MEIVEHENNTGFIDPIVLAQYGSFGFFEKLKMRGIGSSKVIYRSGIDFFDEKLKNLTDVPMVNFELMKRAVLLRLTAHQKCYTVAILKEEIEKIVLKKGLNERNSANISDLAFILHKINNNTTIPTILFEVQMGSYQSISSFFEKPYFQNKFN